MLLFLPTFLNRSAANFDPGAASFNLATAWAAIEKVVLPTPSQLQPVVPLVDSVPSKEAKRAKTQVWKSKLIGVAVLMLAGIIAFYFPRYWFAWSPVVLFGCLKFFFIKIESEKQFVDKYLKSTARFEDAVEEWRTRCGITQALAVKSSLAQARYQLEKIDREKPLRLSTYQSKRRGMQFLQYIESKEIRKAKIRHVGPARQTALASYGIETALDITEERILQVPGFGAKISVPLLEWRKSVEKSFVYDPKSNEMDKEELQKIQFELDQKGSEFRKILTSGPTDLAHAVHAINVRGKKEDPIVARAYAEFRRDKEDLLHLSIAIPKRSAKPDGSSGAAPRSASSSSSRTAPGAASGATSGAATRKGFRSLSNTGSNTPLAQSGNTASQISCPKCGQSMVKRVIRRGSRAGKTFYGCSTYPACNGAS